MLALARSPASTPLTMFTALILLIFCVGTEGQRMVLQLISRGDNGLLVANQSALARLESLQNPPLEVLSVVGGFHTGKSFLMNHLMSLPDGGFKVDWSVDPTTHGMQAWAQPDVSEDKLLHVLVIDTEGLSATENDHDYDAKIFAISALISTQLLYCSQSKINHRDIEYLELLAQRSHLFAMKSAHSTHTTLSVNSRQALQSYSSASPDQTHCTTRSNALSTGDASKTTATEPDTVLDFPPLTWVVNSWQFPLDRTPKEYLDRLLAESSHATSGTLRNIFSQTDAHLLSPPVGDWSTLHTKKKEELSPVFLEQLGELRAKLTRAMTAKPGRRRSGRELAQLIRLCVDRANSGDMGSIPSMWELVLESTVSSAKTAAEQVHREMILGIHARSPPVMPESWDHQSGDATRAALKTFRRAVKDFQHHKIDSAQRELSKQFAHETERELQVVSWAREGVNQLALPMPSAALVADLDRMSAGAQDRMTTESPYDYGQQSKEGFRRMQVEVEVTTRAAKDKNNAALSALIEQAAEAGEKCYLSVMNRHVSTMGSNESDAEDVDVGSKPLSRCVSLMDLRASDLSATRDAFAAFHAELGVAEDEPRVTEKKQALGFLLAGRLTTMEGNLATCVRKFGVKQAEELIGLTRRYYSSLQLERTPLEEDNFQAIVNRRSNQDVANLHYILVPYALDFPSTIDQVKGKLEQGLDSEKSVALASNTAGWSHKVENPLAKAYAIMESRSKEMGMSKYFCYCISVWEASFVKQCRSEAHNQIVEVNEGDQPMTGDTVNRVVDAWIRDTRKSDMARLLDKMNDRCPTFTDLFSAMFLILGCAVFFALVQICSRPAAHPA